jgi:hypothetical protein
MTREPIRLATPVSGKMIPIKRHMAAEVKLKRTRTRMKAPNSAQPLTRPTMGYIIIPITIGGRTRSGSMSNSTYRQRGTVERDFGEEVDEGGIVSICAFPDKENSLAGEDVQRGKCAEPE